MENTSKALLIAAAVLIAIILITLGLRALNSTKGVEEQAKNVGQSILSATDKAISQIGISRSWKANADGTYTSSDGIKLKFRRYFRK